MKLIEKIRKRSIAAVRSLLRRVGIALIRVEALEKLRLDDNAARDLKFLLSLPETMLPAVIKLLHSSKSQLRQDLFVLSQLNFKKEGYFVEFGATNGIDLSNTYLLEKEFNWHGILAEPAKCWHKSLPLNRTATIETRCVWRDSNSSLNFTEVDYAELSTLAEFTESDLHASARSDSKTYVVETISLLDLLVDNHAPGIIDYLSIDTEGSEYEILKAFPFSKYRFRVITCEHNYTDMRDRIYDLLTTNGYTRVSTEQSLFDDWYIDTGL